MGFDKFDTQFDKNFRVDHLFKARFKFWFFKQSNLQINGKGLLLISAWNIVSGGKDFKINVTGSSFQPDHMGFGLGETLVRKSPVGRIFILD